MHTLNRIINRGLWIFGPPALAILVGFAFNSGLKQDGIYIGHPRTTVVYMSRRDDPRLQQLAAALPSRALTSKK